MGRPSRYSPEVRERAVRMVLEQLLHEEEGPALDFKRDQYTFEGADNDAKGELLKDILAFANAWRRTTAYVLIGVDEVKGGRSKVIGVTAHLDDAQLHQFVNSNTQRPVEFSYLPFRTDDGEIGAIEIPVQERPIYLTKRFERLDTNAVYKRDSSTTAIATPDKIARMGEMRALSGTQNPSALSEAKGLLFPACLRAGSAVATTAYPSKLQRPPMPPSKRSPGAMSSKCSNRNSW